MQNSQPEPSTPNANGVSAPRSPFRAVLMTLLMPGLGHVYCGELVMGLAWAALGSLSGVISLWALATRSPHLALASIPMWVISLAAVAHVVLVAKKCPADYQLRSVNRVSVYLLLLAISSLGVVGFGIQFRTNYIAAYVTPSRDMEPTLRPGDRFLVDKTAFNSNGIEMFDLVVFKNPELPKRTYIKRVAALPGSTVEVKDGQLYIDGELYEYDGAVNQDLAPYGPFVVPEYNVFVVGDNLGKSRDSRHFGPIPNLGVIGKASFLFWPHGDVSRFGTLH